jgi:hypothetical protein
MKEIWEFDQWSIKHWEEVKNGNVDKTKSWVQLEDYEEGEFGERITIFTNQKAGFVLESQYDQWDKDTKKASGCDFVEWINGTTEPLDEDCPTCGNKLVLYTTAAGKKMKKCSTSGWDSKARKATGCAYVEWLKAGEYTKNEDHGGEEFLPPDPNE